MMLRLTLALFLAATLCVLGGALFLGITVDTDADALLFESSRGSRTTRLYTNGNRGGGVYVPIEWESERLFGSESAIWCEYGDMPERLKLAFLAAEDHRFFSHRGVDWLRTAKALANRILRFEGRFGGSTITQQLVKNITGDREISASRKLREAWRALAIERRYSKEEILELYLNIVPMGENCIGVSTGAERYFGKAPGELSLAECAALAAIINAPTRYDPYKHPEENRERREMILAKMLEYHMIGEEEYRLALAEELAVLPEGNAKPNRVLSWYTETVIDDVIADLCRERGYSKTAAMRLVYGGGLQIYTLADLAVQRAAEESFTSFTVQDGVQYAGAVIDPQTGDLLAIVGAAGKKEGNRLFNHATSPRPPGSALKPLSVYAPALDGGLISSASVFDDVPLSFEGETGREWPRNSPDVYAGLCDLGTAIATSKNTVAVRVLRMMGMEKSYALLSRSLGFSHLVRTGRGEAGEVLTDLAEAPLALGQLSYGVTVRELGTAYTTLAGDGSLKKGRTYLAVYDKNGKVLLTNESESTPVFAAATASIMTKHLEGVVKGGTANGVRLPYDVPVAGKTGTTSGGRDRWFVGYSPYYLCSVWCGTVRDGVSVAGKPQLAVFNLLMGRLHRELHSKGALLREFPLANGVFSCRFCRDGGGLMTLDCLHDPRGDRSTLGWFTAATLPKEGCHCHIGVLCGPQGGVVEELDGTLLTREEFEGEQLVRSALIRVPERSFPRQIRVMDAQYVYRPLGEFLPSSDKGQPYFSNSISGGAYMGLSPTQDGRQFNAAYQRESEPDPFEYYRRYFEHTMPAGLFRLAK